MEPDDFVYNPRISTTAPFGPIKRNKLERTGAMSPLYYVFRPHDIDLSYLEWFFQTTCWHDFMRFNGNSGARSDRFAITDRIFNEMPISMPQDIEEQKKLGSYLTELDNLITLHQRKHRFFTITSYPWEQRKLGECLSEITYGFTNPMSDTEDGPWKITAKDIVDGKIDFSSARHTSIVEYDGLTDKSKPIIGDLLLTKDGTLGRTAIVNAENICINQSVALLRFNEKCSAQYAKTLLDTPMCQKQMLDDAGGGTIKHIYITKVDKMFIPIPSKKEQERLVSFFDNLNNFITLHQRIHRIITRRAFICTQR